MKVRRGLSALLASLIGLGPTQVYSRTYVVRDGETLSEISQRFFSDRFIWTKDGGMNIILAANPRIRSPHVIYKGQKIELTDRYIVLNSSPYIVTQPLVRLPSNESESLPQPVPTPEPKMPEPPLVSQTKPARVASAPVGPTPPLLQAPAETPAPRAVVVSKSENGGFASFTVTPSYSFDQLTAIDKVTGATASLSTSSHLGLSLQYLQNWSPETRTYISGRFDSVGFESPTQSTKSLEGSNRLTTGFGVGVIHNSSRSHEFEFGARAQKLLFLRAASTSVITFDSVTIPSLHVRYSPTLITADPFSLGLDLTAAHLFAGQTDTYQVENGREYYGGLFLKQASANLKVRSALGFSYREQNTSITRQSEKALKLSFDFDFPFFESKRPEDAR